MNYYERQALSISKVDVTEVKGYECPICEKIYRKEADALKCRDEHALELLQKSGIGYKPYSLGDKDKTYPFGCQGEYELFVHDVMPKVKWVCYLSTANDNMLWLKPIMEEEEDDIERVSPMELLLEWRYANGERCGVEVG